MRHKQRLVLKIFENLDGFTDGSPQKGVKTVKTQYLDLTCVLVQQVSNG
jgi:hypothetical protein